MTEQEYRQHPALNYSLLAALDKDPKSTQEEREISYDQIEGKVLDKTLFDKDNFFDEFYILDESKLIEDKPLEIANALFEELRGVDPGKNMVVSLARRFDYYNNYKDEEKLYNKVWNTIKQYYQALAEAGNRYIITHETYQWALIAVEELKAHEFTRDLIYTNDPDITITFQKPLFWKRDRKEAHELKGLLDIEVRNDKEKWVRMVDLKKAGRKSFESDFYSYRYYIQEGMYKDGLVINYPKYKVLPSAFVVSYRKDPKRPDVFYISKSQHVIHKYGGYFPNGKFVKGYLQLADEFKWHTEKDLWDYSKETYFNRGKHLEKLTENDPTK